MKLHLLWLLVFLCVACTAAPIETDQFEPPQVPPDFTPQALSTRAPTLTSPPGSAPTESPLPVLTLPLPTHSPLPDTAGFPDLAPYQWELTADNLEYPLGITHAGDGSGRLFILSQVGLVYIRSDGVILSEPFLDLRERVSGPQQGGLSERGLLGLAFHPRYVENGYFYVNYTDLQGNTVIARYQVSADPNRAEASSELRLLTVQQPYPNHNGGGLAFGPDGYLYIALGDGGSAGDPEGRAQSLTTHLGKLLRIAVDGVEPYTIPADNPFANGDALPEIWAYGLRNPWRFSFDSLTGDLYIGDVGQNLWEEVNFLEVGSSGGANFGWDYREGLHPYEGEPPAGLAFVDPVAEYAHAEGCSITGGVVVRDPLLPDLQGVYLYGDYCTGKVWGLLRQPDGSWQNKLLFETSTTIASFGVGEDGRVYLAGLQGSVYSLIKK